MLVRVVTGVMVPGLLHGLMVTLIILSLDPAALVAGQLSRPAPVSLVLVTLMTVMVLVTLLVLLLHLALTAARAHPHLLLLRGEGGLGQLAARLPALVSLSQVSMVTGAAVVTICGHSSLTQ